MKHALPSSGIIAQILILALSFIATTQAQNNESDKPFATIKSHYTRAFKLDSLAYDIRNEEENRSRQYLEIALDETYQIENKEQRADMLGSIGQTYAFMDDLDKSILLCSEAAQLNKELKDFITTSRYYHHITLCNQMLSKFDKAVQTADSALLYAKKSKDDISLANAYKKIGLLSYKLKDNTQAIAYFKKLKPIEDKINDDTRLFSFNLNLGIIYKSISKLDSSRYYLEKAEQFLENPSLEEKRTITYVNLAALTNEEGRFKESIKYGKKALATVESEESNGSVKNIYHNLGGVYTKLDKLDSAIYFYDKSLEHTRTSDKYFRESVMSKLGNLYFLKKDYKNAYKFLDEAYELNSTIYSEKSQANLVETQVKYDVLEKEKSLLENHLKLAESEKKQQQTLLTSLLALLLLSLFGFWIYYKQKQRRNKIALALNKNELEVEKLKELDKIKTNFFTNISHELRTPLTLILGPLSDLLKDNHSQETKSHLLLMDRNARRLKRLIDQMLELAKIESGKSELNLSEGNVLAFIKSVVASFDSLIQIKKMKLFFHSNELDIHGTIDPEKVQTILYNLISNAIKFSHQGDSIQVFVNKMDETLEIKVVDEGKGMTQETASHAFDHFYSSSPKGVDTGTGIGLALSKQLAELHHGNITVVSELNKGSSFSLHIPLNLTSNHSQHAVKGLQTNELDAHDALALSEVSAKEDSSLDENQQTILVVDDNQDMRTYIRSQLKNTYEVVQAADGLEAMDIAKAVMPELIVLDVMMPKMDGFTFCKALRNDARISHIPVVMLTAKSTDTDKVDGLEAGADAYMLKPFKPQELLIRIKKLIESRDALRRKFATSGGIQISEVTVTSMDERFLKTCLEVVEKNIRDQEFSIDDLAKEMDMSRSQFYKKLKALTDKSPSSFIRSVKLHRAKALLTQNAGTVSEIAYELGFNSLSYFSRTFKEEFGVPPTEIDG